MSTPTRYARWRIPILTGRLGYEEPVEPDPDPEDPTDYANLDNAGAVEVAVSTTTTGELLTGETVIGGGTTIPPANLANANDRNYATNSIRSSGAEGGTVNWWWGCDFGSGVEITSVAVDAPIGSGLQWLSPTAAVVEFSDDGSAWTASSHTYSTSTVPTGLVFPSPTSTTRYHYTLDTPSTHQWWRIKQTVGFGFHLSSGMSELSMFGTAVSGETWEPAPGANDGDDATYAESDVLIDGATARIALEVERVIYRARVLIACENSGSRTYSIYGSDDAGFTAPVLLDSVTFTATGSFTEDEIELTWVPAAAYQYYEIRGNDETRRFHTIELYSADQLPSVTDHAQLTGLGPPADDHTQYELATEGGQAKVLAHGNLGTTETVDPTDGNVHTGTLDANCTITLNPPPATRDGNPSHALIEVRLTENGTGGFTPTFAASGGSIEWVGGSTPTHTTTANSLTVYLFETVDGGTTWLGMQIGGGGSALIIEDEGTPLATAATSLDFVGSAVTASGTGASKTITISAATDLDDLTDVTITAPTEDDDLRYNGSVWVNDSRKWECLTDGEDVFVWEGDDLVFDWST